MSQNGVWAWIVWGNRRTAQAVGDAAVFALRHARRVIISVVGGSVLLLALVGVFLPLVPAVVLFPLGLAILATEFVWARRWLKSIKQKLLGKGSGQSEPTAGSARRCIEIHPTDAPIPSRERSV